VAREIGPILTLSDAARRAAAEAQAVSQHPINV